MAKNKLQKQHPPEVKPLLHEFHQIFMEELSKGVPPMREVQHAIDFIPGFVIPNRPTYKISSKSYEELQSKWKN